MHYNELQFEKEHPLSKKMEEIIKIAERVDSEKSYLLHDPKEESILKDPKNKKILNNLFDKKTNDFLNRKWIDENKMKDVLKLYNFNIQSYHKEIDKIQKSEVEYSLNFIKELLKKYNKNNISDEKLLLIVPSLDQPIETEYDMNLFASFKLFSNDDKYIYAKEIFKHTYSISERYYQLAKYISDNNEIEYFEDLYKLKKDFNSKSIFFSNRFMKMLEKKKIIIEKSNPLSLYKKEISLYQKVNMYWYEKLENEFIWNYFKKNKYNWWYEYIKWFLLETYYNNQEYNDEFIDKNAKIYFEKNINNSIYCNKKEVVLREDYRKDIEYIKSWLSLYMYWIWFWKNLQNIYISNFNYDDWNKNHTFIQLSS